MDWEIIKRFMAKHQCSHTTAAYYFELRHEGCEPEAALKWCGLA